MKISRRKLKQIIAEELNLLTEQQLSDDEQQVVMGFLQTSPQLQEVLRKIGLSSEASNLEKMTVNLSQEYPRHAPGAHGPVA
jgi:hypothetical protein